MSRTNLAWPTDLVCPRVLVSRLKVNVVFYKLCFSDNIAVEACRLLIQCAMCRVSVRSLCDRLLVIRRQVDDLVALLSQDVQHTAVPQEVT